MAFPDALSGYQLGVGQDKEQWFGWGRRTQHLGMVSCGWGTVADLVEQAQSRWWCAQAGVAARPVYPVLSGGMGAGLGGTCGRDMRLEAGR